MEGAPAFAGAASQPGVVTGCTSSSAARDYGGACGQVELSKFCSTGRRKARAGRAPETQASAIARRGRDWTAAGIWCAEYREHRQTCRCETSRLRDVFKIATPRQVVRAARVVAMWLLPLETTGHRDR